MLKTKICKSCKASFIPKKNEEYCEVCMPYHKRMENKRNKFKTKLKGGNK